MSGWERTIYATLSILGGFTPSCIVAHMPSVLAPAKALVTGGNGFVGAWVTWTLLEQGYSVLGAVRSARKGDRLRRLFASYGDKFDIVVVDDITKVRLIL